MQKVHLRVRFQRVAELVVETTMGDNLQCAVLGIE